MPIELIFKRYSIFIWATEIAHQASY
ncbi:hypothetical protein D299_gp009 [Escherichia phage HX01]|nr:hypothetical protein D299_gp009 [Escherichia phage HX01]